MKTETVQIEVAGINGWPMDINRVPTNRVTEAMMLTTFTGLMNERPDIADLYLRGAGEPLLVPNLTEMIRHASKSGIFVSLDTNGTLLYRDRAEELVDAGLGQLRVLLDGEEVHGFEADFQPLDRMASILENLAGLSAVKRMMRSDLRIKVIYVVTPENLKLLPDIVALLGGIWVSHIRVLSTLDPTLTKPVFAEASTVAEEYCVVLDLSSPQSTNLPFYYDTTGTLRHRVPVAAAA